MSAAKSPWPAWGDWRARGWLNVCTDCGRPEVVRPARELAERAGHARASMSLDVYSHVMPPDEVASERLFALIEP